MLSQFVGLWIIRMDGTEGAESKEGGVEESTGRTDLGLLWKVR